MNNKEITILYCNPFLKESISKSRSALFLDRDGVIIKDTGYISKAKDVSLELGIKNILKNAFQLNIPVIIVTNQSGISRGYYSWDDFDKVNKRMFQLIGEPSPIVGIYANSHLHLSKDNWRKPNPGMILSAAKKFQINLKKSILIGDRHSDMIAGCKSGIKTLVHVRTGHGKQEYNNILEYCKDGYFLADNMKSKIIFYENLLKFSSSIFDELSYG